MVKKLLRFIVLPIVLTAALVALWIGLQYWTWSHHVIAAPTGRIVFDIQKSDQLSTIARRIRNGGGDININFFVWFAKLRHLDRMIQPGTYEIQSGDTARDLMQKIIAGNSVNERILFTEGKTFKDYLAILSEQDNIKHETKSLNEKQIAKKLGAEYDKLDGLIFPATYPIVPGISDLDILKRAYLKGQKHLRVVWDNRDPDVPYRTPYDMLIMASIIEKESAIDEDKTRIAGVFVNRLRKDMPLQTDPTVIYALGDRYTGRLKREDMKIDSPWNTYIHKGLPPSPISNPGLVSLEAAAHPEKHDYLFFVSSREGRSEFAKDYETHKQNIQTYLIGSDPTPQSQNTQSDKSEPSASDSSSAADKQGSSHADSKDKVLQEGGDTSEQTPNL